MHLLKRAFTILLPSFLPVVCAKGSEFSWDSVKYVYAFGDSYTFVQGVSGYPNYSFIGDALDPSFTPEELLSNEIVPKNVHFTPSTRANLLLTVAQTSSEGSNWLEFLTGCFEGLPSNCETQLWDFAFAGADIDVAILPRHHDFAIQLVEQVDQWIQYASDVIPHPPNETMTFWWIGINDTGDTMHNSSITDFAAFWETEMISYFNAVVCFVVPFSRNLKLTAFLKQRAYETGLKTHLFINVPPGDRAPSRVRNATEAALAKEHIKLYNVALANHTRAFASRNPDAVVMTFDANAWFNEVLDDPAAFGFTNVTGFCTCEDPSGYFWYNTGHPTEQVHRLLADAIKAQLKEANVPASVWRS
ncbi:hypothetical protein VNI00_002591 [Paramarasmius palmivorus]|uniref:Carbohydrate esterase family 16 protein n=1 Tax=Paramarasmius palmivorus TaxID=297713 RepID=A0AAW0DVC7_9AGAR